MVVNEEFRALMDQVMSGPISQRRRAYRQLEAQYFNYVTCSQPVPLLKRLTVPLELADQVSTSWECRDCIGLSCKRYHRISRALYQVQRAVNN